MFFFFNFFIRLRIQDSHTCQLCGALFTFFYPCAHGWKMHTPYDGGRAERFFTALFDLTRTRMEDRQIRTPSAAGCVFFFFPSPLGLRGRRGSGRLFFFFLPCPRGGARRFGVGLSNAAKMRRVQHKCEYWG